MNLTNQIALEEILPSEETSACRAFVEAMYEKHSAEALPCRNRHEGYGLLAAADVDVLTACKTLKTAMADALGSLAGDDDSFFVPAADAVYAALMEMMVAVTAMANQAMNVITSIQSNIKLTPLEEMAEEEADE